MLNDAVIQINCDKSVHLSPDGVHVRHDVAVTDRLLQPLRRGHQLRPEIQHRLEKSWTVLLSCIFTKGGTFVENVFMTVCQVSYVRCADLLKLG